MPVLEFADFGRPENFHEIARHRFFKIVEIFSEVQFVKQSRRPRAVRIPASPDAFAVALVANDQLLERAEIQAQRARGTRGLDCFHEHEIRRARAIARRSGGRENEKLSRLEMRCRLQPDGGEARGGIFPAHRHLIDLLQNRVVEINFLSDGFVREQTSQCQRGNKRAKEHKRFIEGLRSGATGD
jgi:hypothetical protein